jgi:hypothetical protein
LRLRALCGGPCWRTTDLKYYYGQLMFSFGANARKYLCVCHHVKSFSLDIVDIGESKPRRYVQIKFHGKKSFLFFALFGSLAASFSIDISLSL